MLVRTVSPNLRDLSYKVQHYRFVQEGHWSGARVVGLLSHFGTYRHAESKSQMSGDVCTNSCTPTAFSDIKPTALTHIQQYTF